MKWSSGFGNWTLNGTSETQVHLLLGLGLGNDGSTLNTTGVGNGNVVVQMGASTSGRWSLFLEGGGHFQLKLE